MGEGLVSRDSDKAPCVFETYDDIESEAGARFIQATADKAAVQTAIAAGQSLRGQAAKHAHSCSA